MIYITLVLSIISIALIDGVQWEPEGVYGLC